MGGSETTGAIAMLAEMGANSTSLWTKLCRRFAPRSILAADESLSPKSRFQSLMLPFVVRIHEYPADVLVGCDTSGQQLARIVDLHDRRHRPHIDAVNEWFHAQTANGHRKIDDQRAYEAWFVALAPGPGTLPVELLVRSVADSGNFRRAPGRPPIGAGVRLHVYFRGKAVTLTVIETGVAPQASTVARTFPCDTPANVTRHGRRDPLCCIPRSISMTASDRAALAQAARVALARIYRALASGDSSGSANRLVIRAGSIAISNVPCYLRAPPRSADALVSGDVAGNLLGSLMMAEQRLEAASRRTLWKRLLTRKPSRRRTLRESLAALLKLTVSGATNITGFLKTSPQHHFCIEMFDGSFFVPCSVISHLRFGSLLEAILEMGHFWTPERLRYYPGQRCQPW